MSSLTTCLLQEDSEGEDFDPVDGENEDEEEGMYLSIILGNLILYRCIKQNEQRYIIV